MEKVVLVIHLIVAVAMVIVVLLQRSEGAGLVGPSASSMAPIRSSANILTRTTAILAAVFFVTSLTLAVLAGGHKQSQSLADQLAAEPAAAVPAPVAPAPVTPPTADAPAPSPSEVPTPPATP